MKETKVKCPKCGKEWTINIKNVTEETSCPHCHKVLHLQKKYQRLSRGAVYAIILLLSVILSIVSQSLFKDNLIALLGLGLGLAFITATIMDKVAMKLAFLLFNFKYEEVVEENKKNNKK